MTKTGVPSESRPKKPAGWYSATAKQQRARERSNKRRLKLAAERARLRRNAHRSERNVAMGKVAARRLAPKVLAKSIADAKAPPPRKKPKKAKPTTVAVRPPDTVVMLRKRGDITRVQERAAERYRDAFEAVQSHGLSGSLNPDRGGGGGSIGRGIAERVLIYAEDLNQAAKHLGRLDGITVSEIIGKGRSVEDFAKGRYGVGPDRVVPRRKIELVKDRLADALGVLAEFWFPAGVSKNRVSSWRAPGAKPVDDGQTTTFERKRVAHAGGEKKVSYSEVAPTKRNAKRA